jgi:uncharacterized protein YegP (UPF0339 family)
MISMKTSHPGDEAGRATSTHEERTMTGNFELKNAANGRFLFNLKAGNGEIILTSGIFATKDAAIDGIAATKTNAADAVHFERKIATNKEPYFVLKSTADDVLGRSETYSSTASMENGIKSVMRNAVDAPVKDLTEAEAQVAHK